MFVILQMEKRQFYYLENPEHVQYLLITITDDMAIDSDAEGDEDADDNFALPSPSENTSATDCSFLSSDVLEDQESLGSEAFPKTDNDENLQQNVNFQTLGQDGESSSSSEENSDDEIFDWQRKSETPKEFLQTQFSQRFGITRRAQFDVYQPISIF